MAERQTVTGRVRHVQVEVDPAGGPILVCRVEAGGPHHLFLRLAEDNRQVFETFLILLRDALTHPRLWVRATYDPRDPSIAGGNCFRLTAVRLQDYQEGGEPAPAA